MPTVLVTGAARGIGRATALRLAASGWNVIAGVRRPPDGQSLEEAQPDTDIWRRADAELDDTVATLSPHHRQLYAKHIDGFRKSIPRSQRIAAPAEGVAATIETALTDRRPRARYVVGRSARIQALLAGMTPTPVLDVLLRAGTGVPRRA